MVHRMISSRCPSKRPFSNRKTALSAATYRGRKIGRKLYVFHCLVCHSWHLTSQPQTAKQAATP